MKKKFSKFHYFLTALALTFLFCSAVCAAEYTDVPTDHWAKGVIDEAADAGIMQGNDDGSFGLGKPIRRCEFAAMLTRMMGWDTAGAEPRFADVPSDAWYFAEVNTLADHGVCDGENFRPTENITRREMAVMLVKAMGYHALAEAETSTVFSDVTEDAGYIAVAYELGIINGKSAELFDPEGQALREQGAAMMMRLYEKMHSGLDEIHGFYAISSWSQKELAADMDAVSFGWSRLQMTDDGAVWLNQTDADGNDWCVPAGSEDAVDFMRQNGLSVHLAVTMTDAADAEAILTDADNRREAVMQIAEAARGFDGITIDFEGLKGAGLRDGLNAFAAELRAETGDRQIYICVHPVLSGGDAYYDAYDYQTLGETADKLILMAQDYDASVLPDNLLRTDFIATPVTPITEVYHALKRITDAVEPDKVLLALSPADSVAWETENGQIVNGSAIHPAAETVQRRLQQPDTKITYSAQYKNPYAFYTTEDGQEILLWYEDSRSIADKIDLAKMFGVRGVSMWRLGIIPNGGADTYMDVWNAVLNER